MRGQRGRADVQPLAHDGRHQRHLRCRCERGDALERLHPGVQRQVERAVVAGEQMAPLHVQMGLQALLGVHVDVGPVGVVGAGFDQRQIERAKPLANGLEAVEVARVATEEDARLLVAVPCHQHP